MPIERRTNIATAFQREDCYIVIKRSHLKKVPIAYRSHLIDPMFSLLGDLPRRECVVVESDSPEYHMVWAMLEHRLVGKPVADSNLWRQADALVAPRDEGLAREVELRSALQGMLQYFPEGYSDGERFSVETAKAALAFPQLRGWGGGGMSSRYLYRQNIQCGVYLGSLGDDSCESCGWRAGLDAEDEE